MTEAATVAVNDQYRGEFMPGISSGAEGPYRAPGTAGASGQAADSTGATVTPPWGGEQDAYPGAAGTVMAGQSEPTQLSSGPAQDYVSEGPRPNRTDHFQRYPWQQGRQ